MVVVRRKKESGSRRREDGDDKPADDVCSVTARYLPYIPVAGAAANGNRRFYYRITGISASSITLFGCLFQLLDIQYTTIHCNLDCTRHFSSRSLTFSHRGRSQDYKRGQILGPAGACKWTCAYICRCQ